MRLISLCILFFVVTFAYASINIQPTNFGSLGNVGGTGVAGGSARFYYVTQYSGTPASSPTPTNYYLPPSLGSGNFLDIYPGSFDSPNAAKSRIEISFSSNNYTPPALPAVGIVMIQSTLNGATVNIPIASVNGVPCNASICYGKPLNDITNPFFYGALYPGVGQQLVLGFYASDVCWASGGGSTSPCNGTNVSAFSSPTSSQSLTLSFNLISFTPNVGQGANTPIYPNTVLPGPALDSASTIIFNFVQTAGTMTCPSSPSYLEDFYFPGDGSLNVTDNDVNGASLASTPFSQGNSAPPAFIIPIFSLRGNPIDFSSNYAASSVISGGAKNNIRISGSGLISPLDNSLSYNMSYLIQDSAGMIIYPTPIGTPNTYGCTLFNVQSSRIEGFLDNSSGCGTTQDRAGPKSSKRKKFPDLFFMSTIFVSSIFWMRREKGRLFF